MITAPLTTSYISLQLSSKNSSFFSNFQNESKIVQESLSKMQLVSPELRRKYALLIESTLKNSKTPPFKAVQFGSYREVFRGLNDQGFLALYKGNFLGIVYNWLSTMLKIHCGFFIEDKKAFLYSKEISLYLLYTAIDMLLHPIQNLQTRFILQNRNRKLALYPSILTAVKSMKTKLFFQGVLVHLPKNAIIISALSIQKYKHEKVNQAQIFILSNILANILTYPLMTIMRRLMCQDNRPFMLERRYKGTVDAVKKIWMEEGFGKGFFKGFGGFFIVSTFMMALNFSHYENSVMF